MHVHVRLLLFTRHEVCNGIQNCDGGEDEDASVTGPCHEENCPFSYFRCEDKQACVPKTWVCDGDNDCEDNSDEQLCRKFVVIHGSGH